MDTAAGLVTERRVPLPERWVKGLGEVQALTAAMRPLADLTATAARRFLQSIPRGARRPLWAVPARDGLALAVTPRPGAACVAGPGRMAELARYCVSPAACASTARPPPPARCRCACYIWP